MADSPLRPVTPGGRRLQLSPVALPIVPEIDEVSVQGGVRLGLVRVGHACVHRSRRRPGRLTALLGFFVCLIACRRQTLPPPPSFPYPPPLHPPQLFNVLKKQEDSDMTSKVSAGCGNACTKGDGRAQR